MTPGHYSPLRQPGNEVTGECEYMANMLVYPPASASPHHSVQLETVYA